MIENQAKVLKWLGLSEGGYVNHPRDPGGATNLGVTQRVYDSWRKNVGKPIRSVKHITKDEAHRIFVQQYFSPVWFNKLPSGLDYAMADYSVNSGPSRAVKDLQRTLNELGMSIAADGHMGVVTMHAIDQRSTDSIIIKLCERRMRFLKSLSHWSSFGVGWTRRVMGEKWGIQDWDGGVIDRGVKMSQGEEHLSVPKEAIGKGMGETTHKRDMVGGVIVGAGSIITSLGTLFGSVGDLNETAQYIMIGALVVGGFSFMFILRRQIREWAEG